MKLFVFNYFIIKCRNFVQNILINLLYIAYLYLLNVKIIYLYKIQFIHTKSKISRIKKIKNKTKNGRMFYAVLIFVQHSILPNTLSCLFLH